MADGGKVEGLWWRKDDFVCSVPNPNRYFYSRDTAQSKCIYQSRKNFKQMGWTYVAPKELVTWND